VTPDLYDRDFALVTRGKFSLVEGPRQNQDGVIHVKATRLLARSDDAAKQLKRAICRTNGKVRTSMAK
jgi:hypothetical protein